MLNISILSFAVTLHISLVSTETIPDQEAGPWVVYEGQKGPGFGHHIVFVTGDDEYRSEEGMPMLAKILAFRHGFKCTVLFAINTDDQTIQPDYPYNIPGLEQLAFADLMILFIRFRELPDDQMKHIMAYVQSGKPLIGLRTATHSFFYRNNLSSPYAKYSHDSSCPEGGFGQLVLGDTWISHHGDHGSESTRGVINHSHKNHPVLQGVRDIWGPSDVYTIQHLPDNATVLVWGQVIQGMQATDSPVKGIKNNPMMPLAWTKHYLTNSGVSARVMVCTMGASTDLQNEGLRRLLVNSCYWGLTLEKEISPESNVDYVGPYQPTNFGFGGYTSGIKPDQLQWPSPTTD